MLACSQVAIQPFCHHLRRMETAPLHGNEITKVTAMTQFLERKDLCTLSEATDQLNFIQR